MANTHFFLPYFKVDSHLVFSARIGGGPSRTIIMDTGSSGIVVPASQIKDSTPMPQPPDPPSYSSSGNSYEGQWVLATVELTGGNGVTFTTAKPVAVFAATNATDVSMMGVGIRYLGPGNVMNPFLHLPQMASGQFRSGYILTRSGVIFGYDASELASFATFPTKGTPALSPQATVTLTPPAGSSLQPYTVTAPLLLDTGIEYMIVTPRRAQAQPDKGYQTTVQVKDPQTGKQVPQVQLIPGVTVTAALEGQTLWTFNTRDFGRPAMPAYARFAVPSPDGIVNTGRHLLDAKDYLADIESGVIGFRDPLNS